MVSTVTSRGQTAIPAVIRRRYHITAHTKLEWIDDGHMITVLPVPSDPIRALRGKIRKVDLVGALLKEREEDRKRG